MLNAPKQIISSRLIHTVFASPHTIKAGTYKGQDKELTTFSSPNIIAVHKKLDNETVYQMTNHLLENKEDLVAVAAVMKAMQAENVDQIKIPLHPGAEKYYKEKNLIK